jgi:PKD repeat protein
MMKCKFATEPMVSSRCTGNNTSASSGFIDSDNGNAGAANTSKVSIRRLLYPGSKTKVYAHWVGWFGPSNHIQVGYKSDDPAQVRRQVNDMISRGIDGVVVDWFGPNANPVNASTQLMKAEAEAHPGFEFIIMEDVGALGTAAKDNGCDVTAQLINDLKYAIENYASSPAYSRIDGRPVIMFFGVTAYFIDWDKVRASVPGNPLFIFRGASWFNNAVADGAFQWVDLATSDPFDPQLGAQDFFYRAATTSSKVSYGSAYTGFADGVAAWSVNRFIHQRCGRTWLATFAEIAKFYSATNQLQAMQLVTWNDYEEGTELESGIDNCLDVNPSISGGNLTWTVTGPGTESSVHHYTVFISKDGQNLAKLADLPASTHAFNLAALALPRGSYTVYVKAVGQPSVHNQMSPPIVYTPGNEPPKFSLNVTLNGATNVTASITGASDTNGFGTMQIDFGDGTVVTDSSASHTYNRVKNYTITATVFDNDGASAVVRKRVTPKPPGTGVTIFGPSTGAVINAPALITATANSGKNITAMRIYVDGKTAYTIDRDFIRTAVKIYKGTHRLTVQAWDATGAVFRKEIDLIGEPNDIPPVARVTVRQAPGGSDLTVLACSATSSDPDGFLSGRAMQFSDGSPIINGPTALHTFAAAGNYSVNLAVMDQFGAVGSTSLFFSLPFGSGGGGGGGGTGVTVTSPADGAMVSSPVRFIATATSPNAPITAMAVYADYKRVALVNGGSLDQSVALAGGIHPITVQAWDATGAVFKKSLTISISTTQGGVSVASPSNGSTISSPVHFVASATSPNAAITAMAIYIDSQRVALVNNASIDQSLTVGAGSHYAVVQAWDATGAVFKTPLTITVSGATVAALN